MTRTSAWLWFSTNWLCLGRETPDAIPGTSDGGDWRIARPQTGIWMISRSQIDTEISRQRAAQQEQLASDEALAGQSAQAILAKYDRNKNGVIDPDEKEDALDDPGFIKARLDEIDANHNGWLDAPELAWFDANQNKVLDPKERAGIRLAIQFLAEKLIADFDQAGDGWLGRQQYDAMIRTSLGINPNADFDCQFAHADANHDNHVDSEELQGLMQRLLEKGLQSRGGRPPGMYFPGGPGAPSSPGIGSAFKAKLEAYWQNQAQAPGP